MKRALLVLLVLAFVVPAFADDALTLPQGVWRTRIIPVYSFADNAFDDDFSADRDSIDKQQVFSLGFAVEYGIKDWITAAAQWTPGFVAWSDIDTTVPTTFLPPSGEAEGDPIVGRWFDVFLGTKFQIIGAQAPVRRSDMRFAVAAGLKVPLPSSDWDSVADDLADGDDFFAANADRNTLGLGFRLYYDYVFSPSFFVNLYSETIFYPFDGEAPSLRVHKVLSEANALGGGALNDVPLDKFQYGYDLKFEIEPTYVHVVSPGLRITPSLPVTFFSAPEIKLDGTKLSDVEINTPGPVKPFDGGGSSSSLTIAPTVEFFFTGLTVPTALQVAYRYPIAGQNSSATNALIIQIKNYLKFW